MSDSTIKLAAIMFTDIVGYTMLMGEDSKKALDLIRKNRELQKPLVAVHNGKWIKEMGDGTFCYFGSALDAVNCAIAIQEAANLKLESKMRIGIHLGDVSIEQDDIYGNGVNIASRLESICDPGGIYISGAIKSAIQGQVSFETKYLGELSLKNVSYPVATYALQGLGLPEPGESSFKDSFWNKMNRRLVVRAAASYVVFFVLLLQLFSYFQAVIAPASWLNNVLVGLMISGFPIALYLAWNYELSPDGFIRTSSQQSFNNPYKETKKKPLTDNFTIIGMTAVILLMYAYPRFVKEEGNDVIRFEHIPMDSNSVAVIPFVNMSAELENQYFADGQMEAILNHLARIADLRVISRTTMMGYRKTTLSLPEIGRELGARYVLEGSVQKSSKKVRITAKLIDSELDRNLWSESYDRDLTDIFDIQTEIAVSVARQLSATITSEARTVIEAAPTTNLRAYDFYLRGMNFMNRSYSEEDYIYATQMFRQAVELDPDFTLAWVGLANTARMIYVFHFDKSEKHIIETKAYLDRAIELEPNLMEVQLETGSYYYHLLQDFPKALGILERLKSDYPKNADLYHTIGAVHRRMGQFQEAFMYMDSAISINPSGWVYWDSAGETLIMLRKYKQAEEYLNAVIRLNPSVITSKLELALMYMITGEIDKAKNLMLNSPKVDHPTWYRQRSYSELLTRNYAEALRIIESSPHAINSSQFDYVPKQLRLGLIYYVMGDQAQMKSHFQSARALLEEKVNETPEDSRLYSSLGMAYAGLGMKEEALAAGKTSISLMNISTDALRGFTREVDYCTILVMTGQYSEAIVKLEELIQKNGFISVEVLKNDPIWDQLRNIESFKRLINNPKYQIYAENNSSIPPLLNLAM